MERTINRHSNINILFLDFDCQRLGITYTYDNLDRVTEVKASKDGTSYTIGRYIYDKLGRVARFIDGQVSGKSCTYGYDLTDRLCEAVFDDGTAYRYTYDANDCLVKEVQTTPDGVRTVTRVMMQTAVKHPWPAAVQD